MNKTVLLGAVGAAVTVAALAVTYAVTWRDAAVEPVPVPGGTAVDGSRATGSDSVATASAPAAVDPTPGGGEEAQPAATAAPAVQSVVSGPAAPVIPEFDIVRINRSGDAVIGGRAAPGSLVTLYRDGRAVESITADDRGEWVMLPGVGVLTGAREISLAAQLPGQPEIRSDQVVVLVTPDPSAGGSSAPLALVVPREEGAKGAAGAQGTASAETSAAAAESTEIALAAPAPEPAVGDNPSEAIVASEPAPAAIDTIDAVPEPLASEPAGAADATASAEAIVDLPDAAAAESAAAAVLELPSADELVDTATDAAADDVAYAEAEDTAPPSPDELLQDALDGAIAEGRAAEALEFFGVLPEEEPAPSLAEATVPAATVAPPLPQVAEAPPVIAADEPQRTTGAGVDSAPTRLLDVAAVTPPELPPARVALQESTHHTVPVPVTAEPPVIARTSVTTDGVDSGDGLDLAVSREAGPGVDSAALPPSEVAAAAVRPEVTENITVTEIMIELKWSRPNVTTGVLSGEVVAAASLPVLPETPAPFRFGDLPVLSDMPAEPLWVEAPVLPPVRPREPIMVAAVEPQAGASLSDAVALQLPVLPKLDALASAPIDVPVRTLVPQSSLLAVETAPSTVRFAALQPAVPPLEWTERIPMVDAALPPRSAEAAIAGPYDAGGRAPLDAQVPGLDLLASAGYRSTIPGAASSFSSLDSASYQSATPGVASAVDATAGASSDSVDALLAEAQSALDAVTRAQEALDGAPGAASTSAPPVLPDGPLLAAALPVLGLSGSRPPEALQLSKVAPVDISGETLRLPAEIAAETADKAIAAALAGDETTLQVASVDLTAEILATTPMAEEAAVEGEGIAPDEPARTTEPPVTEPSLELGSFQRDERLTGDSAYKDLDSETLRGEGIRSGTVALQSVEYDDKGEVIIGGTATPNAPLNIYVDNVHVGSAVAGAEGEWSVVPNQPLTEGLHYLRVDQVEAGGKVVARVESPFARVEPVAVTGGDARVVVQPGNSLWRIARRTLGGGTRYTAIYEANKSQIADPDMIYPGQVFVVPSATSNN